MQIVKYLVMSFKSTSGDKSTLSLTDIRDDLTAAEISAAMDVVVARNMFSGKGEK